MVTISKNSMIFTLIGVIIILLYSFTFMHATFILFLLLNEIIVAK